jgi:hypothetical protein
MKRSKPVGNSRWGIPWADWEEQSDDDQEGTNNLALCLSETDEDSASGEDDTVNPNGDFA